MFALDDGSIVGLAALVVTLWLASVGAAVKIAMMLATIASELKDIRRDATAAKVITDNNQDQIARIQQHFDIPQAAPINPQELIQANGQAADVA